MKSKGARTGFARLSSTCAWWLLPLAFLLDGCGLYLVLLALDIIATDEPASQSSVAGRWLVAWACMVAARVVLLVALDAWRQKSIGPTRG